MRSVSICAALVVLAVALLCVANAKIEFGIDAGYDASHFADYLMPARRAINAPISRHQWREYEPVTAQEDLFFIACNDLKTRFHAVIGENSISNPRKYASFLVAFIRRYGVGGSFWAEHPELDAKRFAIQSFELLNEPYLPGIMTAEQYAKAIKPALDAVYKAGLHKKARIVVQTYVYGKVTDKCPKKNLNCCGWGGITWIQWLYKVNPKLNKIVAGFALHPYWHPHAPNEKAKGKEKFMQPFYRMDVTRKAINMHGGKSKGLYITEYGSTTALRTEWGLSEARQASNLDAFMRAVITNKSWKVHQFDVYQLFDRGTDSDDPEEQFGLIREDGSYKPAFHVVKKYFQQYPLK